MNLNGMKESLPSEQANVLLNTSMGEIELELYWKETPLTCANFVGLAKIGYYDGVLFHRVVPGLCLQGGDPTGTGRGGASIYNDGAAFEDELDPRLKHTGAGILSMANSGPNTNKSQFFISLAPLPWLDGKHTIFGRVSRGMKVVERMSLVETDHNDRPKQPVQIYKAVPIPLKTRSN